MNTVDIIIKMCIRDRSKEDAMDEFKTRWGENGYLLNSLQENPLPNSVVIMIGDLEKADSLAQKAATYDLSLIHI